VGDTVPVRYREKDPQDVELHLEGDPRWDHKLREQAAKEQRKALLGERDAEFDAALHAQPGSAPPVGATAGGPFKERVLALLEQKRASGELTDAEYQEKKRQIDAGLG